MTVARFEHVPDDNPARLIVDAEIDELASVKTRQAVARRKPQKTARIARDARHRAARQPVGRCVMPERKLFGAKNRRRESDHQKQKGRRKSSPDESTICGGDSIFHSEKRVWQK